VPDYEHEDPRVQAALQYACALVLEWDAAAFDAVYQDLRAVFDDAEVVELACFAAIAIGGVTVARSLHINP
jgi:alkylhydroperoxidase family enzyme